MTVCGHDGWVAWGARWAPWGKTGLLRLLFQLRFYLRHVATDKNVADGPSRGVPLEGVKSTDPNNAVQSAMSCLKTRVELVCHDRCRSNRSLVTSPSVWVWLVTPSLSLSGLLIVPSLG